FGIGRSGEGPYGDGARVNRRLARADDFDALDDRLGLIKRQCAARANGVYRHWVAEPVEDDLLSPRAEEICGGNLWNRSAAIVRNERFAGLRQDVVGKHLVGARAIVETAGLPGKHDYRSPFGGLHVDKGKLIGVRKQIRKHARKNNRVVAHAFEDEEVPRNGLADDDLVASVEIEIGDYGITQINEAPRNYVIENQIHLIVRSGFENFQRRRKAAE